MLPIGGFIISKISSIEKAKEKPIISNNSDVSRNSNIVISASKGKILFLEKCAACHHIFKDGTGPALTGLEGRGLWADRVKLYEWIRNPSAFMKKDPYTESLKTIYGSVMTAFPGLSNEEIDAIVDYINQSGNVPNLLIAKR